MAMILSLVCSFLVACGKSSVNDESSDSGDGITIFNSKQEVQDQMQEMAKRYTAETGVNVTVYYSNDTVSAHLATRYASNNPYTLSMVDAKDIYSLAEEHALDLSDQQWVNDTLHAIRVGGKVFGFPVCVEARGIIYNADAIEKIIGKPFVPSDYATLDSFKELIKQLKTGGMESPTGVMKEDWSLAAHYLAQIYEEREDPDAFVRALSEGTTKLIDDPKFNSLMDSFDVLMNNSYSKASAISAEREVTERKLAEGEIAFLFGGNWDWSMIKDFDHSDHMGIMPIPQNTDDGTNTKLVGGGSKYFFIDSSDNTTPQQKQQAKDFLNWLVYNQDGQSFIVNDCALVPAFSNITLEVSDPLGASVKSYVDADAMVPNYNYLPDDHYAILGAQFQKYLAGKADRKEFAKQVQTYWKTKTLTAYS